MITEVGDYALDRSGQRMVNELREWIVANWDERGRTTQQTARRHVPSAWESAAVMLLSVAPRVMTGLQAAD